MNQSRFIRRDLYLQDRATERALLGPWTLALLCPGLRTPGGLLFVSDSELFVELLPKTFLIIPESLTLAED